ncbi:ClpP family protease [Sinomicrobium soli]|uniref:ClpP family protease n=1 Tax=Sinomicrobium sp. N-1-3-6 TaxID=2219864 RepID=UPI000DCC4332|nr:ATP-dependent Clp protease proteolytic subunit [Sinomicrobium sp. N-1-3-6]RAV28446.1 ATP-dependent Clp protease proteolytic subunit [Sinomicrobium sp. N-1-3-6]
MKHIEREFAKYARSEHGISSTRTEKYITQSLTPYIVEERSLNVAQMDVFSRLMMDRIIFLGQAVDDQTANIIQAQLLFLQSLDTKKDISLYINSPGGSVYAGFGIYDTMQYISPDVATICTGVAASMAAVLLCAGARGKRCVLKHSRVMIHQTSSGTQGTARDMEISVQQVLKIQNELFQIIADHSGNTIEKIRELSDRDHWMTAREAKTLGLVDEVLLKT